MRIELTVNGEHHQTDVWEGESLLVTLRDRPELEVVVVDGGQPLYPLLIGVE